MLYGLSFLTKMTYCPQLAWALLLALVAAFEDKARELSITMHSKNPRFICGDAGYPWLVPGGWYFTFHEYRRVNMFYSRVLRAVCAVWELCERNENTEHVSCACTCQLRRRLCHCRRAFISWQSFIYATRLTALLPDSIIRHGSSISLLRALSFQFLW